LLLACANVANLLVAQAASRRTELQIRAALGAARGRIVRQLLTESALLATFGTVAGVLIAFWCVDLVRVLGAGRVPRLDGLQVDASVLVFACFAGAASCLFFGLAPAVHAARVDLRSSIDEGYRYTSGGRRLRHALVVLEVALALLLVVSAGLMANSFVRIMNVHPGFDVSGAIGMPVELPSSRYDGGRVARFYEELLERVRAVPGVTAAAATSTNPFRGPTFSNSVTPEERAAEAPRSGLVQAGWRSVTPGFFETMGIAVSSGRTFRPSDRAGAERVVIVSESLARRLWPGGPAVGQRIYWGGTTGRTRTVVGVVGDVRDVQLEAEPPPMLFLPHAQVDLPSMTIVARTPQGMASVAPALRGILRELDPAIPAPSIYDIESSRAATAASSRFNLSLLGVFAVVALVLAVTGVYAMLAFTVAERRREIAVRLALGADGSRIARLVLLDGLFLAVSGIAAGAAAAFAATRLLSGLLYGVTPTDPWTFGAAATVLIVAALFACVLPARQAMRVDAIAILRE
jgi:predicted permease